MQTGHERRSGRGQTRKDDSPPPSVYLKERTLIVDPVVEVVCRFMLPVLISIWSPDDMKKISKLRKYKGLQSVSTLTPLLRLVPDLQAVHDLGEVGATNALFVPALDHQRVDCTRACFRACEELTGTHHVDDFLVAVAKVGLDAVRVNLPQDNA